MAKAFSRLTGRVCSVTRKTLISCAHDGVAARPQLIFHAEKTGAAICSTGAKGGRLRESLEMQLRAEAGSTVMVDSASPVKLLPHESSEEYGIGIHASIENDALLVITPEAHVPSLDAHTGLWTRYDLSPKASLVSVQLADLKHQVVRPPTVGGRYTSRTRVHFTESTSSKTNLSFDSAPRLQQDQLGYVHFSGASRSKAKAKPVAEYINASCALPAQSSCGLAFTAEPSWKCDWTFGRRFKGTVMGSPRTNVVASVLLVGDRAATVVDQFRDLVTFQDSRAAHDTIGLRGDAHLAIQDQDLRDGKFVMVRMGTEHREDMHRLLQHCLAPLNEVLGLTPYARMLHSSKTSSTGKLFPPPTFLEGEPFALDAGDHEPSIHAQLQRFSA